MYSQEYKEHFARLVKSDNQEDKEKGMAMLMEVIKDLSPIEALRVNAEFSAAVGGRPQVMSKVFVDSIEICKRKGWSDEEFMKNLNVYTFMVDTFTRMTGQPPILSETPTDFPTSIPFIWFIAADEVETEFTHFSA